MYSEYIKNKNILVTGDTGTFGNKFIKTFFSGYNPNRVESISCEYCFSYNSCNNSDWLTVEN